MAYLISLDEIKKLEKADCKEYKKVIEYFYRWQNVGFNTINLVFIPDELYELVKKYLAEDYEKTNKEFLSENFRRNWYRDYYGLSDEEIEEIISEFKNEKCEKVIEAKNIDVLYEMILKLNVKINYLIAEIDYLKPFIKCDLDEILEEEMLEELNRKDFERFCRGF